MANSSIGPGRVAGDPTVHDLKAIRYNTTGKTVSLQWHMCL